MIWIPRWMRVPARLIKVCTCLGKCYIPLRMWLISFEPDTWNRPTESIKVIIHLQWNSWKVCGEKKKKIRTTDSAKEEQFWAKMVTKALKVASDWPSGFMTISVSSYAPAVTTLKLWWICNIIDLILGFPFLHQEFKTFILYFAVFVVVTPRATVCKCGTDEKKVRGRSLLFSWKYARCFLDFYWCPVLARLCM